MGFAILVQTVFLVLFLPQKPWKNEDFNPRNMGFITLNNEGLRFPVVGIYGIHPRQMKEMIRGNAFSSGFLGPGYFLNRDY